MVVADAIRDVLRLPPDRQVEAALEALRSLPADPGEPWNLRFGPGSRFEAWNATTVARRARRAVAEDVRRQLDAVGPGWTAIEVGGGDGTLWAEVLRDDDDGTLWVVDPVPEATRRVADRCPPRVRVEARIAPVQEVALPPAHLVVCSLTLHHVAGADRAQREAHGLAGPGKTEILASFRDALRAHDGVGVLVEADVDCDIDLHPGDPVLADNLLDSYVRRCARSILADIEDPSAPPDLAARWQDLLHHWFLAQVRLAWVPTAERDVYERTVPRWLDLLDRAGLEVVDHAFTDDLPLFHRYRFR